jgi:ankyrin repeat protein
MTETHRYIVRRPEDINLQNQAGDTPFNLATSTDYSDLGQYLLDQDDDEISFDSDSNRKDPLKERLEFAQLLLDGGSDIGHQNKIGNTPLLCAARLGCPTMLGHGANLYILNQIQETLLIVAASGRHVEMVRILMDKGACS